MRSNYRMFADKVFTVLAGSTVILMTLVLVIILGPMLVRGSSAVFFRGTVEFRKLQQAMFDRGNTQALEQEIQQVRQHRDVIYSMIEDFKQGIDADTLSDKARSIYRQYGNELRYQGITGDAYRERRSLSREIRKKLEEAFQSNDRGLIEANLNDVLGYEKDERFAGTAAAELFELARQYQDAIADVDLEKRQIYRSELAELESILNELFGPRPDEPLPSLAQYQYGATRWDMAQTLLHRFFYKQKWVEKEPGRPLVAVDEPRRQSFAGTSLVGLFDYMDDHVEDMLRPEFTVYWQYFIDDSTPGHYFGGIGPEIFGTLMLTLLSMLVVIPLGIISAAYLVECASDNMMIRIIRMSINTLAGVPSIVFGLFGLAFFVLYLFPALGFESKPCMLAASLTLSVLTLPVMIRASEEAIRTVPRTYKEASLALGASGFRTFMAVTLPAALPGILTGVILSLSRVAGETAPILFTGAVALGPVPDSLFDRTRTLSYGSYDMAVGDRLAMMVPHNQYGMVVTLIVLVLILNGLSIVLRGRIFKKLQGR